MHSAKSEFFSQTIANNSIPLCKLTFLSNIIISHRDVISAPTELYIKMLYGSEDIPYVLFKIVLPGLHPALENYLASD